MLWCSLWPRSGLAGFYSVLANRSYSSKILKSTHEDTNNNKNRGREKEKKKKNIRTRIFEYVIFVCSYEIWTRLSVAAQMAANARKRQTRNEEKTFARSCKIDWQKSNRSNILSWCEALENIVSFECALRCLSGESTTTTTRIIGRMCTFYR